MEGYAKAAGWMSDMGWSTIASLARPPKPGSAVVSEPGHPNSPRSAGGLSPLFVSARPMHTLLAGPVQWRAKFL
jgi:hypothetical protein